MCGAWFQRAIRAGRVFACAALVVGCTQTIRNDPINQQLTTNPAQVEAQLQPDVETNYDDMVVALSFSGGGMRAAAFSYGVLQGFNETEVRSRTGPVSLLDRLDFLSGVSGGSVLAAYYGLRAKPRLPISKSAFCWSMPRRICRPISASAISRAACRAASTIPPAFRSGSTIICTITRR
jgi:hypothetical protein